jgi:heme-degrading monooxygenase HmoA
MAEVVVIEFAAPDAVGIYNRSHVTDEAGDKLIVVEAWESKADQERFMASKLGPAFHEANVPAPTRVEWFSGVMNVHS